MFVGFVLFCFFALFFYIKKLILYFHKKTPGVLFCVVLYMYSCPYVKTVSVNDFNGD